MIEKLTPSQIRGARGMLNWSMSDLAHAAAVSVSTIKRLEKSEDFPLSDAIRLSVRNALIAAGIFFIDDDGRGAGIRLVDPTDRSPLSAP